MGRAAAGGRAGGASWGRASRELRRLPVRPPAGTAGASRAAGAAGRGGVAGQVSGGPWGEGASRGLGPVASAKSEARAPPPAPPWDRAGAGRPARGGGCGRSSLPPWEARGPKCGPEREAAGPGWAWSAEAEALTPAHHLRPGCSPSPPASPALCCSGRCCCCSWGQRLPRIRRSPTATRWGPWGRWPGMGWAGTEQDPGGLLLGKILPSPGWWSSWGRCLEQSGEGGQAQDPDLGLVSGGDRG